MNRPKTRIPIKKPSKGNDEEDVMSTATSTSIHPNYERITYYPRGQNWRKMFDEEIGCDITIDVDGNIIRTHKCVLISRCQYFAAMFSGRSKDSINTVYLDGFSYECVRYALIQIYSGDSDIPENIDIFELADLADLLNFEGLKDLVSRVLEEEYFHNFHKPCEECTNLMSKFIPWSGTIGYTDTYYKILSWIKRYYDEVWLQKDFASLPYDIIKQCFDHHTMDIDTENVLEIIRKCEKLMSTLPKVAWTANIFRLSLQLLRDCVRYMSAHLADVLSTEAFMLLGREGGEKISSLEDRMTAAIEHANPLQVCAAYAQLHRLLRAPADRTLIEWRDLLTRLAIHCEDALISCASQAMSTSAWVSLQPDLQARIRKCSGVMSSSTFSKLMNNPNKCTRERNVEKIKYILYSQLGNINRVPTNASRQHLPAPTASKRFFVAPKNSMVTSTKTTNISNVQSLHSAVPLNHNAHYKNIKPRYLNPKPVINQNVDLSKKPSVPQSSMKNGKRLIEPPKVRDAKRNVCRASYIRSVNSADKRYSLDSHISSISANSSQRQNEMRKTIGPSNVAENQTKTLVKNPPISYVSPYCFKPSGTQIPVKTVNNQKSNETFKESLKSASLHINKNRCLSGSMSVDKKNISVSDTALSVKSKKVSKDLTRINHNRSPTFKQSTYENSSSYSSSVSYSSMRMNPTVFGTSKPNRESLPSKDVRKAKLSNHNHKGKSLPTFAQSTVSSSAKITQKSVIDVFSNPQIASTSTQTIITCDTNSIPTENINALPNENNACAMSRSRTFLKKEPSIISKEITMDSSIEMYPE